MSNKVESLRGKLVDMYEKANMIGVCHTQVMNRSKVGKYDYLIKIKRGDRLKNDTEKNRGKIEKIIKSYLYYTKKKEKQIKDILVNF